MASAITLKQCFFDKAMIIKSMDAATHQALYRGGNRIKTTAQRSMRYRKKASAADTAPSAHRDTKRGPLLRKFLFNAYDPMSKTQLIGPQGLGRAIVPKLTEEGGSAIVTKIVPRPRSGRPMSVAAKAAFRRKVLAGAITPVTRSMRVRYAAFYPARPYMRPALDLFLPQMPKLWQGQFRKVA